MERCENGKRLIRRSIGRVFDPSLTGHPKMQKDFVTIAQLSDVPESRGLTVRVGEDEVALFNLGGEIYAMKGRCPHRGGSLGEGTVENATVFCPLHGWQFEVKTGACFDNPERPAQCLPVRVVDGQIQV